MGLCQNSLKMCFHTRWFDTDKVAFGMPLVYLNTVFWYYLCSLKLKSAANNRGKLAAAVITQGLAAVQKRPVHYIQVSGSSNFSGSIIPANSNPPRPFV